MTVFAMNKSFFMVYDFTPNIPIQYAVMSNAFQRPFIRPLFVLNPFILKPSKRVIVNVRVML